MTQADQGCQSHLQQLQQWWRMTMSMKRSSKRPMQPKSSCFKEKSLARLGSKLIEDWIWKPFWTPHSCSPRLFFCYNAKLFKAQKKFLKFVCLIVNSVIRRFEDLVRQLRFSDFQHSSKLNISQLQTHLCNDLLSTAWNLFAWPLANFLLLRSMHSSTKHAQSTRLPLAVPS